jgi:uncharacterized protein YndB with AHSA1/START domain
MNKGDVMTTSAPTASAVEIRRTFAAPRDKVFQAWVEPGMLSRWFLRPTPQHEPRMLHFDPRTTGGFRFEIVSPENGKLYVLAGSFIEIQPPSRLVFTWRWESEPEFPDSVVTVEFRQMGSSDFTEVVLSHGLLPESARENHRKGWTGCFDALEAALR